MGKVAEALKRSRRQRPFGNPRHPLAKLTWGDLRLTIARTGPVREYGVEFCREGTFCAKCAAPMHAVYDHCPVCRGMIQIEAVETRRWEPIR